jgi:MFS family permease
MLSLPSFANALTQVSYYLSPVLNSVGVTSVTNQTLINGFFHLWNLIISVTAASLVDRVGRRPLLLYSSFGKLACYIAITGLSGSFANTGNASTGIAVIPMLFIFFAFYDLAWTPLIVSYPAEIWQYNLRSRGIAVVACSTFGALFFNLFVNPIALAGIGWKYYIIYVALLVIICISVWFYYPETRGRSLEEMAVIFDGPQAAVPDRRLVLERVEEKAGQQEILTANFQEGHSDIQIKVV